MRYQLKQAVHLKGKDYAKGVYEFSEAVQKEPYFHKLVLAGLIVSADDVGTIKTPQQRVEDIQEHLGRVRSANDPKPPAPATALAPEAQVSEEEVAPEPVEEDVNEKGPGAAEKRPVHKTAHKKSKR